jgi:hypothetical protein
MVSATSTAVVRAAPSIPGEAPARPARVSIANAPADETRKARLEADSLNISRAMAADQTRRDQAFPYRDEVRPVPRLDRRADAGRDGDQSDDRRAGAASRLPPACERAARRESRHGEKERAEQSSADRRRCHVRCPIVVT